MKTLALFLFLIVSSNTSYTYDYNRTSQKSIIGIYEGLTENMEFRFIDSNDKVYFFDEIAEGIEYDLYDESYFGQKFKVSWEGRDIEILDIEDEPTGKTGVIRVITGLQKL